MGCARAGLKRKSRVRAPSPTQQPCGWVKSCRVGFMIASHQLHILHDSSIIFFLNTRPVSSRYTKILLKLLLK